MTAYPTYKRSKALWVETIPEHWEDISFKHIFDIIGGNGFRVDLQGQTTGDYPFYKTSDINGSDQYIDHANNYVNQDIVDKERYNIIPQNAIILSKIGEALRKNHRKVSTKKCVIDNNLQALVAKRNDSIDYLYYLMCAIDMDWFNNEGTIPSINNDKLRNSHIPMPSYNEQCIIANYLKCTVTALEELIREKKTLVEDLAKYKNCVITEAVTKGLKSTVTMQAIGNDWIKEIPQHWSFSKLKYIVSCNDEVLSEDTPKDQMIDYVEISDVDFVNGINGYTKYSFSDAPSRARRITQLKDVIISTVRTYLKAIAQINNRGLIVSTGFAVLRAKDINPDFLSYAVKSNYFINAVISQSVGVSYPAITAAELTNISIPVPPLSEQVEIAEFLKKKTTQVDNYISELEKQINDLVCYKKSIISEAVTGKIDLRDWSPEK